MKEEDSINQMYKFRLTIFPGEPGFFQIDTQTFGYSVKPNIGLEIYPRDTDSLITATKYHIDCGGFKSQEDSLAAGEKLRKILRLINSILDLGINIPVTDSKSGSVYEKIKEEIHKDHGIFVIDSNRGLSSIPDDGLHVEAVTSGSFNVRPSDPLFLFDAIKEVWDTDFNFDSVAEEVIELLNISANEKSEKLKFLTCYLALESLIELKQKSTDAQKLISSFIKQTNNSNLTEEDKKSLVGSLGNLKQASFSSSFKSHAMRITSPEKIQDYNPAEFASICIGLRNKFAHSSETPDGIEISKINKGLRELVLGLLWTKYKLPKISIYRPADQIIKEKFNVKFM